MKKTLFVWGLSLLFQNLSAQNTLELLEKAQKALQENKIQEAISLADQVLQKEPQNAQAYYLRGLAKYAFSEFANSVEDYTKALQIQPTFKDAYYNRGVSFYWLNQNEKAEQDFFKALQLDSTDARTYTALGSLYSRMSEIENSKKLKKTFFQKAENAYQKALQFGKDYAPAYYNYALLISENNSPKSLELIEKYILLKPQDAQGYLLKGILLKKNKKWQEALVALQKSAELNPYNPETFLELGSLHFYLKNKAEAQKAWQNAQKLGSSEATEYLKKYFD
ncbi:MAG: tetratricopeptide repeat protein [Raineya sp.]|nr:tetratricopeptide repeat protein [Raineya sp.]